jgi:hypothetical protein
LEHEVSISVELGVCLGALVSVIALILFTVSIGNNMKADAFDEVVSINKQVEESTLSYLVGLDNEIPSAAAYNILKTYANVIERVDCHIAGCNEATLGVGSEPCIANHLSGKLNLEVRKNSYTGYYVINVHTLDCEWYDSPCSGQKCTGLTSLTSGDDPDAMYDIGCDRHGMGGSCTCK